MKSAIKAIFDTIKVFVLFVVSTILFYFGLQWFDKHYESYHKFDTPDGKAVKVYNAEEPADETFDWHARLLQFFRNGE